MNLALATSPELPVMGICRNSVYLWTQGAKVTCKPRLNSLFNYDIFLRMFPFMLMWSIFIKRYGISFPRCLSKHANSLRSHLISALFTLSLSISISSLSYHPDRLVQTAIWNRFNHQTRSPVSGSSRFEEVILHLVLYFRLIFKYFCGWLITDLRYRMKL